MERNNEAIGTGVAGTLRVSQHATDLTLSLAEIGSLRRGDLVGDGMWHGSNRYSWTRLRVVANDRDSQTLVCRFPDGEYAVTSWDDSVSLYINWDAVCHRAPFMQDGLASWAA
jgi:hypothetical protein